MLSTKNLNGYAIVFQATAAEGGYEAFTFHLS